MSRFGINVPKGIVASTLDEVEAAAKELPGTEVVVKSQVLAGGRGLGTFKNGFKGGVHIVKKEEARSIAGEDWFNIADQRVKR
jgi:succinyl-CoA synthetase beta subunit